MSNEEIIEKVFGHSIGYDSTTLEKIKEAMNIARGIARESEKKRISLMEEMFKGEY